MTINPASCVQLWEGTDRADVAHGDRCLRCDGPVGADGFHHESVNLPAAAAVKLVAQLVIDFPRLGLVLCGIIAGLSAEQIIEQYAQITGKACTRQNIYDSKLALARRWPDLQPLLFTRAYRSRNKRAPGRRRKVNYPGR